MDRNVEGEMFSLWKHSDRYTAADLLALNYPRFQ